MASHPGSVIRERRVGRFVRNLMTSSVGKEWRSESAEEEKKENAMKWVYIMREDEAGM